MTYAVRLVAFLGCISLMACEAVPTEESSVVKLPAGQVSIGIKPVESQVLSQEPLEVLFYLNNDTDASIEVLPWSTPLESSMTADRFAVSINGEVIPYSGRIVKRPPPRPQDYITLQAGEKKETVVSLSDGYDVRAVGEYKVMLKELVFQMPTGDFLAPVVAQDTVTVIRQ